MVLAVGVALVGGVAKVEQIYAVSSAGGLVRFDSASPGKVTTVGALRGLVANHNPRAIDFGPADGRLHLLSSGRMTVTNGRAQLYTVDLASAVATPVGAGFVLTGNSSNRVSMDFNPVVDRLRVVTGTRNNYRVNPNTGAMVQADGTITYDAGDPLFGQVTPVPGDVACTNNFAGAISKTLYYYEYALDTIATMGSMGGSPASPNTGTLFTVGDTGLFDAGFFSDENTIGFDISGVTGTAYVTTELVNIATGAANPRDSLFSVNLETGLLSNLGSAGVALIDSAGVIPEPGAAVVGVLGMGLPRIGGRRRR